MKKVLLANLLMTALLGCSDSSSTKKPEEIPVVDNATTRYVGSLQTDVTRAQIATDRMNRAIEKTQNVVSEVQSQTE